MYDTAGVLARLRTIGDPARAEAKARRFGIQANNALGIHQAELTTLAREIGYDSALAIALFETGVYEARLLCSKIFNPADLCPEVMEKWAATFETWEICDSFCMGLFVHSELATLKIRAWSTRDELYVRRAAYAMIAAYGFAHKGADNAQFISFLDLVRTGSADERHYVKKAVSWALRNIGKRNRDLHGAASALAHELAASPNRATRWVGRDALRELDKRDLGLLDYPREIYRAQTGLGA